MQNNIEQINLEDLGFVGHLTIPSLVLPKAIVLTLTLQDKTQNTAISHYTDMGFIQAELSPTDNYKTDIENIVGAYSALIDRIRQKYKYLPIIATGADLSSIAVRELAHRESERLGGAVLVQPSVLMPSSLTLLRAEITSKLKGKNFVSDMLGSYGLPLASVISYLKKLKELDSPDSLNEYPKHIPTLIINAKDDTLFDALDDAYVSGVEKAVCTNDKELENTITGFLNSVVEGVNDAISTDSFIYRGADL